MLKSEDILSPFSITAKSSETKARAGVLYTRRGAIHTPVFMPVATQASVKALNDEDLKAMGVECILSNTYHLYLRPGTATLKQLGGLHKFMKWDRSILTDSGGFQVFSLSHLRKITEEGVLFQSHHDGSKHLFTPENVIRFQSEIDSDIWVCLDVCVRNPSDKKEAMGGLKSTKNWAERAIAEYHRTVPAQDIAQNPDGTFTVKHPLQFGIVQGSVYPDLRQEAAMHMRELPVHGYCIGGLSVGEGKEEMATALSAAVGFLPENRPRYFMGLGSPEDLWECVERGVDMFDCVWPTRTARNGRVMTADGNIYIRKTEYRLDERPIEEDCGCYACRNYSRAYLSHLHRSGEFLSHRLLSIHNINFLMRTMKIIRKAIEDDNFAEVKAQYLKRFNASKEK
ncbi:MAG: tRNA guanosine(34) transglycosylase Tgt [Elusimicrobiaceae bacterium]|jgi:queuine tRNA-ribosyltransferase